MSKKNPLPDLEALPSVLETSQVNEVLAQILDAAKTNSSVKPTDAANCMVDAIFARGYRPDEQFDAIPVVAPLDLSVRIDIHRGTSIEASR